MSSRTNYEVTAEQIESIRQLLEAKAGAALAAHIASNHPKMLTSENVIATGGGCEAFRVAFPFADDRIIVMWTDDSGGDLPEGNLRGEFLCGVYRNEVSEDPLVLYNGDPADLKPF